MRSEDPRKVFMQAELYEWGVPENSTVAVRTHTTLKTHICTIEELGLSKNANAVPKFYPARPD